MSLWGGGGVRRYAPDGRLDAIVRLPTMYPTSCTFGGPDLRTAFITLSASGQLAAMDWPEPGLRLNFMC